MEPSFIVTVMHSFEGLDGANPWAPLLQWPEDGKLYGTTAYGGDAGLGTIFGIDLSGNFTIFHTFHDDDGAMPFSGLLNGGENELLGTTYGGGADGSGIIFSFSPLYGWFDILYTFTGGWNDGALPRAGLTQGNDGIYGVTERGGDYGDGTIFRLDLGGAVTVHSFKETIDGFEPTASLVKSADGSLYGTTSSGGAGWAGTIFSLDPSGGFTSLHAFDGSDGNNPSAPLMQASDGNLYGTAAGGGATGYGLVFRMDTSANTATLHSFEGVDGFTPGTRASLVRSTDGNLYGTASSGGKNSQGIVFRVDSSRHVTTVHDFHGSDGSYPQTALTRASDGNFYGMANGGGVNGAGTIFWVNESGACGDLHSFNGDGGGPEAPLVQGTNGFLYGATIAGGSGLGMVFRTDLDGAFTMLHDFSGGADGSYPQFLVRGDEGKFLGTAGGGGMYGNGVIFGIDSAGDVTTVHSFDGNDGSFPSGLMRAANGTFYGTTRAGGESNAGTAFKLDNSGITTLHHFGVGDGSTPVAALVQGSGGDLLGTTHNGGENGVGTIFRMDANGAVTTLHSFNVTEGAYPDAALVEAADGSFFGTTTWGGPFSAGVIFRLSQEQVGINEVTPSSGHSSGGVVLRLLGGGFGSNPSVAVGGQDGTDVTVLDTTYLYLYAPDLPAGTLNDVSVTVPDPGLGNATAIRSNAFFADFLDVPQLDPFHDYVEKIFRNGITAGCAGGSYCPQDAVTRAQMAVFLLKSKHGSGFIPPACTGVFGDVACPSLFADWIEQLAAEGITAGCGGGNYCPSLPVTRAQMAVFLLKTKHGPAFVPPPCAGIFGDVACPSLFADWIEQLAAEQITGGCGGNNYCPDNPNTRAQMSAFLVKTFGM